MGKNKNYLFTGKGKKQFNKLSDKDMRAVAEVALSDAMNKVMRQKITESMIVGMQFQMETLYQRHVRNIDAHEKGSPKWMMHIENLLSQIRVGHLEYKKSKGESQEVSDED